VLTSKMDLLLVFGSLTCTLLQRLAAAAQGNGEAENSVRAAIKIKKKMPSAKSILVPTIA
jgi:hypothetical protein